MRVSRRILSFGTFDKAHPLLVLTALMIPPQRCYRWLRISHYARAATKRGKQGG